MSIQADAAKKHIERLLEAAYGRVETHRPTKQKDLAGHLPQENTMAFREYRFDPVRKWRLDYAVPSVLCASHTGTGSGSSPISHLSSIFLPHSGLGVIEVQGGNYVKGAHSNPTALRANYEKMSAAALAGFRVWQFMPEQIIKAGRKSKKPQSVSMGEVLRYFASHSSYGETLRDEPVLLELPWLVL